MKYRYTNIPSPDPHQPFDRRPLINLDLAGPKRTTPISNALVDSGADMCLFHTAYATDAGFDLSTCKPHAFRGIENGRVEGRVCTATIKVSGLDSITIPVAFVNTRRVHVLLGQVGFFDAYRIRFERDVGTFELIPSKKRGRR